jgi:hypothetical protein
MSHKMDRLQLIRERHRKVILEPRQKQHFDVFAEWDDEFHLPEEDVLARTFVPGDEEEE